jgi:hypothetical protein
VNFANETEDILSKQVGKEDDALEASVHLVIQPSMESAALVKKAKYILTEGQRKLWNDIIENVPKQNRVYIQP